MRDPLRGLRLRLTAVTDADLPAVARWRADGAFLRLLDSDPAVPRSEAQLAEWLRSSQASASGYLFGIRRLDDDALLGYIELDGIAWSQRTTWFSIAIGDPQERNRGYGSEALDLLLGFAFGELNLHRVQLTVFSYNAAAIRVYEQAGFRHEGTFREFLERDGVRYDMLLYGILRPEWEARRAAQPSGAESCGA